MAKWRSVAFVELVIDTADAVDTTYVIGTADVVDVTGFSYDSLTSGANGKPQVRKG